MQRAGGRARRPGVAESFDAVVTAELDGLLRYATALCGDRDQAGDIVQEVLARALARWDSVGGADRPEAYLMRMVTNEFLSWRRRWSTRSMVSTETEALERAAGSSGRHGGDHADVLADRDDLERRLARLPRRQQAALVLRFYEGLEYDEAAAVLGCAEGTVRSLCSRGLAALRLDIASDAGFPALPVPRRRTS